MDDRPGRAPDFRAAFLVSAYPLVLMALVALWATLGFLAALGSGWLAGLGLRRLGR